MWAGRFGTPGVQAQSMVGDGEAFGLSDSLLAAFDFGVIKLFDLTAVKANQVIVVLAFVKLIYRFAAFKLATAQNTGLFKLR